MMRAYLGDGVYVKNEEGVGVILTTEDGVSVQNEIVLEPEVLKKFEEWLAQIRDLATEARDAE